MTDPITELQDAATNIRVVELTAALEELQNSYKLERQYNQSARRKITDLLTQLVEMDYADVNQAIEDAGIILPKKKFAFRIDVTATITLEAEGRDEDEAWENLQNSGDLTNLEPSDLEDVEPESHFDYAEEVDDEPLNLRYFLNR